MIILLPLFLVPAVAMAADTVAPGTGDGVWSAFGAFVGTFAANHYLIKRHETRCTGYRVPRSSSPMDGAE